MKYMPVILQFIVNSKNVDMEVPCSRLSAHYYPYMYLFLTTGVTKERSVELLY